jgi:hypothetical protein
MNTGNTARTHGAPGDRARLAGLVYALWPLLSTLFLAGLVIGLLLPVRPVPLVGAGFVLVTLALILLVTVLVCPARVMAYFKGARGEERVAGLLSNLPAGYHVFHGLDGGGSLMMTGRGDIDHAVVGPTGLFVIETKCWQGRVACRDGQVRLDGRLPRRDPIAQVRQAGRRLAECLAAGLEQVPEVHPVVCFAGRGLADGRTVFDEVVLCDADDLLSVLTGARPAVLTAEETTRVANLIGRLVH